MKQCVTFHYNLLNVIKNNYSDKSSIYFSFLLISVDKENVFWMIKIEDNYLSDDFLNLLKFILHYGVKIIGILHIYTRENVDFKTFSNMDLVNSSFYLIRNFAQKNKIDIIDETYISIVIDKLTNEKEENLGSLSCDGNYLKVTKNDGDLELLGYIKNIQFEDLNPLIKNNYIFINTFVNPLVIVNSKNFLINQLITDANSDSNKIGIYFPDLNIMIPSLSQLEEKSENYDESVINDILKNSQKKINFIIKNKLLNTLNSTFLINTQIDELTPFEETNNTFYSVFLEKMGEQLIKSIKLSIICIIPKNTNLNIIDISKTLFKQYTLLLNELYTFNLEKFRTYSLYNFYEEKVCPVPLGIVYSTEDEYNIKEDNLLNQRIHLHKIFNLPEDKPLIRKFKLENQVENDFTSQFKDENVELNKLSFSILKNIHLYDNIQNVENVKNNKIVLIEGDYLYYHTSIDKYIKDKNWGIGYRALQTLISWYTLNGYSNIEIPSINEIQRILLHLGIKSSSFKKFNNPLTLNDVGMVFSYLIDSNLEIMTHTNKNDFITNLKFYEKFIRENRSPLLLFTDKIYTVLGVDFSNSKKENSQILILNHNYNGSNSLSELNKNGAYRWSSISELITEKMEVMIFKTNKIL